MRRVERKDKQTSLRDRKEKEASLRNRKEKEASHRDREKRVRSVTVTSSRVSVTRPVRLPEIDQNRHSSSHRLPYFRVYLTLMNDRFRQGQHHQRVPLKDTWVLIKGSLPQRTELFP